MVKKRHSSLHNIARSHNDSSNLRHGSNTGTTSGSSVQQRLSQLRVEQLNHERNLTAANSARQLATQPIIATGAQAPFVDLLFGSQTVQPAPRIKIRSPGHVAPLSWQHIPRKQNESCLIEADGILSLTEHCRTQIERNIHKYIGHGMHHLPGHLKQTILSSAISAKYQSEVWADLLPAPDEAISLVNICSSTMIMHELIRFMKRLPGLKRIKMTNVHVHFGIHLGLSSVIEHLEVRLGNHIRSSEMVGASWKSLSRRLVTLKRLELIAETDVDLYDEFRVIVDHADWKGSWTTIEELVLHVTQELDEASLAAMVSKIKLARGPGHYLHISYHSPSASRNIPYR